MTALRCRFNRSIRDREGQLSSQPTPAVRGFSRRPPMEMMAVRRGSAMLEISPGGSFLIS
jgi:hypothetical protein